MEINKDKEYPSLDYVLIFYEFNERNATVEKWNLSLPEAIDRCRMIFKDGVYKRAVILEDVPRFTIEHTPIEITYGS